MSSEARSVLLEVLFEAITIQQLVQYQCVDILL